MKEYFIFSNDGTYSIGKTHKDGEYLAENLSLTKLTSQIIELYQNLEIEEHKNPDELPQEQGIRFYRDNIDENDEGINSVLDICELLNELFNKVFVLELRIKSRDEIIEHVRRAVK